MVLNAYIHFPGNAEEALDFYSAALGGEVIFMQRYGDSPMPADEDYKNKVMHARLQFDDNIFMVSDVFKGQPVSTEGNIQLSVQVESIERINEVFAKMSEGGTVTMELQDAFWGSRFGMLKDKFGVTWMFNCELKKEG
jgi:PhnB protein